MGALGDAAKIPLPHADCCGVAGLDAEAGRPGVFRKADMEGASLIGVPTAGVLVPEWKDEYGSSTAIALLVVLDASPDWFCATDWANGDRTSNWDGSCRLRLDKYTGLERLAYH